MNFLKTQALRGPNIWARFPIMEVWVDLQDLKDLASSEIPGFNDRLKTFLPSLAEHRCSEGRPGGFYERLERGTYLAHILEHVALELQTLAGTPVKYGKTRMSNTDGVYKIAVGYKEENLGRAAFDLGRDLVLAAVHDQPFDVAAAIASLVATFEKNKPSPIASALLAAAKEKRIPARLIDKNGLIQLGYGVHQRRILEGQTDASSAVANGIAYDRILTRELLAAIGVPAPYGRAASSEDDAWAAAQEAELPVIVRPKFVNAIPGSVILANEDEVRAGYRQIADLGYSVLVEHATPGHEHRLIVIGPKIVAAARKTESGWLDVTPTLHPRIAERVIDAAQVIGLDVAAVDIIALDLARPFEDQKGTVISVIAQPDLNPHLQPPNPGVSVLANPGDQPLAQSLLDHLFPAPQSSRIPLVSVTGTNGKTTTTRLTAHLLSQVHAVVGMCCTEGIYINHRRIMKGDCSGPKSAKVILNHTEPHAAVVEVARGGILREGLGFDRCDVAVVTNIGDGDHLGASDIDTPEQLANVKSTIVWAVEKNGFAVLNANDPLVVNMTQWCSGGIIFFARPADHPVIAHHRAQQGRAIFTRDNVIVLAEGTDEIHLISLAEVPLTQGGRVGFHVENVLAAAGAAWALGISLDAIRRGLASFAPKMDQVPARFNIMDIGGVTVVLDYGHNTSAVARLLEVLELFPHKKRSVVYSAAGDRRDIDIVAQGEQLGAAFDRVFIYEDTYLRGRREGEITELFQTGMARTRRVHDIRSVKGGMLAIEIAFAACTPGELLVIQPDRIDDGVALLQRFVAQGGRELSLEEALRCLKPEPDAPAASGASQQLVLVTEGRLGKAAVAVGGFVEGDLVTEGWGDTTTERSMHTIQVDRDLHLTPPSPMKYLNHSCEPNCGIVLRRGVENIQIRAIRDITVGEELTLDYETFEEAFEAMTGPCLCESKGCRGRLRGFAHLPLDVRERYGSYIAEYLLEADEPTIVARPTVEALSQDNVTIPHPAEAPVIMAEMPLVADV
jgi:cyanophycin synthetase